MKKWTVLQTTIVLFLCLNLVAPPGILAQEEKQEGKEEQPLRPEEIDQLVAGFALIAWPAEYGVSGVMTLIVNQNGTVYQKDLGPKTGGIAKVMTLYNPDPTWKRAL